MTPFSRIESRAVVLAVDNIDTDQIIPARYLTTISRAGLGDHLFHDWRYDDDGLPVSGFVLNQPGARDAAVLVGGRNFGSGSSREHAAWALKEFGFRAVLALSFADIFRQNALKNGIIPIVVAEPVHADLVRQLGADPAALVRIDLVDTSVTLPGGATVRFPIDAFARECLLNGVDELGYVVAREQQISAYEREHPARFDTRRG
jgi:3-isopropylmalate/(R)-2-methylmalate dehydratase small subunit